MYQFSRLSSESEIDLFINDEIESSESESDFTTSTYLQSEDEENDA